MDKLGLGFNSLKKINNRLIYAAISGFGNPQFGKSPYLYWPSYDVVAQAMGGIIGITGPDKNTPTKVGSGCRRHFFWANDVIWDYLCFTYG